LIGWSDPEDTKTTKPLKWLKSLSIDNFIYPIESFDPKMPPQCIFVPEEPLLHKMIESVAKHAGNMDVLLNKYCDYLPPIPPWMLEQQRLKEELQKEENGLSKIVKID